MTVVGEMPAETTEAPTQAPKSRKKMIIAGAVALAVAIGGGMAVSIAMQKPDPEAVAKTYLQALADGKGDAAVKALSPEAAAAFNDASFKALDGASARIQDFKVGEDAGAKPVVQDRDATVKYAYQLDGAGLTGELSLHKGDDGAWVIVHGADGETPYIQGSTGYTSFRVKIGNGPEVKPDEKIRLFPAVYPVAYIGTEYAKLGSDPKYVVSGGGRDSASIKVVMDADKVLTGLKPKFTKFVQDCLATGQFAPKYKGQTCGVTPDPENIMLNTMDTTRDNLLNLKITKAPDVSFGDDNTQVVASFSAAGSHTYFVREDSQSHTDPFEKTVTYKGTFALNEAGEPTFWNMSTVSTGLFDDPIAVGVMDKL